MNKRRIGLQIVLEFLAFISRKMANARVILTMHSDF